MTVRATWNGTVGAESDATVVVEGNHYFPPEAVRREHLEPSEQRSTCPWKRTASYYDIGQTATGTRRRGLVLPRAHGSGRGHRRPRTPSGAV